LCGINDPEFERLWRRLQPFATDNMPLDAAFATAIRAGNWPMHSPKHGSDRLREMIGSSMLAAQHVGTAAVRLPITTSPVEVSAFARGAQGCMRDSLAYGM
jgi:hypothetical protein